ncbi:hypothetical protein SJR98_21405, partial [Aeromonas hydrophila]|uniref:hypothetical protein n=2 Tax=Aeromonas hydrophila TaxID=644 RepID=UPI0029DB4135
HFESQAIVFAFLSAPTSQGSWLIRLACSAVLVGAHYREPRRDDKGFLQKHVRLLKKQAKASKTRASALFHAAFLLNSSLCAWI